MLHRKSDTEKYSFEIGPIRPPNEGGSKSLLIRATRNCSWNRCAFCPFYHEKKFELRDVKEIKKDIDTVKRINEMLVEGANLETVPYHCLSLVLAWFKSGRRTVFLQDSNSLIMPTDQLVDVLDHLREVFPSLKRITSYARSDTILRKDLDELTDVREAGLTRLHVGLESGDDHVLKVMKKGVTAEQNIRAGRKAMEAGFELSEYVMPGLGGDEYSEEHALNTAEALNKIDPHYIRMRPLTVHPSSELYKMQERGEFTPNSPHRRLKELEIMVKNLEVSSKLCFDHALNGWRNREGAYLFDMGYEGYRLPEEKDHVLKLIQEGLSVDESLLSGITATNL